MMSLNIVWKEGALGLVLSLAICFLVLISVAARADDGLPASSASSASSTPVAEVLVPPMLEKPISLDYPPAAQINNREGWVRVGMMVDTAGKPYEITVVSSSGNKEFERAALQAAAATAFKPGSLNGQPIDSAMQFKIVFRLSNLGMGAGLLFQTSYTKLIKAVQHKDRSGADGAMRDLIVHNLYEDAYYGLAQYEYARTWGTRDEQLRGLRRAIAYEKTANYLPKEVFREVLAQCFVLDYQSRDFAEAETTWLSLQSSGVEPNILGKLKPAVEQMHALRTAATSYDIQGSMPDGTWSLELYKQSFQVHVGSGQIHDVKLRCRMGFVRFSYDPAVQYKVESRYGACTLELDGDPGTSFTLTQL